MKMNNLLVAWFLMFSALWVKAQDIKTDARAATVTTLQQTEQDTIVPTKKWTLDRAYIGSLTNVNFPIEKPQSDISATSVRMGVGGTYAPTDWIQVNSWAILDQSESGTNSLEMIKVKVNVSNNLSISLGKLPRASGNLRPHPVSSNSQFETWTEAQIPWLGRWGTIDAKLGRTTLSWSVTLNDANQLEYNAGVTLPIAKNPFQFAWWFTDQKNFGAATSAAYNDLSTVAVFNRTNMQDIVGNKLIWNPNGGSVIFYNDAGYDLDEGRFLREETGVLFATTIDLWTDHLKLPVGILVGGGYDAMSKEIKAYLFVTFEYVKK